MNPEKFLYTLYEKIETWLITDGGRIVAVYPPQRIPEWHRTEGREMTSVWAALEIIQARVVRDSLIDLALVLGKYPGKNDSKDLTVQFGIVYVDKSGGIPSLEDLRYMVAFAYHPLGSGEFYLDRFSQNLGVVCLANDRIHGGENIERWPRDKQFTQEGLGACLRVVQRSMEWAKFNIGHSQQH